MHVWIKSRKLAGDIEYITFNLFLDPARLMPEFGDAVHSCADCAGIIVDLRGNPGGLGIMAMGMAGWFIEKPDQRLGTMHTRQAPLKFTVNPRPPMYRGPLAILVDGSSASTSEIFAGGMKDLGRARDVRDAHRGRGAAVGHRPAAQWRRLPARARGLHFRRRTLARRRRA